MAADKLRSLKVQFEEYVAVAVPLDLPAPHGAVYLREIKRAFYAGAMVMTQGHSRLADDDIPSSVALPQLISWRQELLTFFLEVKKGNA